MASESMDFLLEVGTEELPASFVREALAALPKLLEEALLRARLQHGEVTTLGTPRRLAVMVRSLAHMQPDVSEEVVGPPKSAAFDDDGKPKGAGIGFAKKHGLGPEALRVVETEKGAYVAVTREESGQAAAQVLPSLLSEVIGRLPFRKSMRWGDGDVAFGRPVQWIVALHGQEVVEFEFAGVTSGRTTRGHRFLCPERLELMSPEIYLEVLKDAHVMVDVSEREAEMRRALDAAARDLGATWVKDAFLIEECATLVEWPYVVPGSFDSEFLKLPADVVVSVMRDHQRYFAMVDEASGALVPKYLNVVNTAEDPETIAAGNDRVLRARLADARFFVDEDRKRTLASRLPKLDKVIFQKKLGSVGDKVRRLVVLSEAVFERSGEPSNEAALASVKAAAELCKTDLETLIVGEFPELQGEMGRFYALEEGVDPAVADAIAGHYRPKGGSDPVAADAMSASVAIADRLDTLVGCFSIGLSPSGSADPFGLRRAALGVIRSALEGPVDVSLRSLLGRALEVYAEQGHDFDAEKTTSDLLAFFRARLKALFVQDFATDLVDACLSAWDAESIRDARLRVEALSAFKERSEYESVAIAFKRTFNIAAKAPSGQWDDALLQEAAEKDLSSCFREVQASIEKAAASGDYASALALIASELRPSIDAFFDGVMVMVDDEKLRDNRLMLLGRIADSVKSIAHLELLST